MSVRVLGFEDVRASLTMAGCIEAMDAVLREHAAGDLFLPLRSVLRPPKSPGFMGLMTAHRAGEEPMFALKAVAIFPENPKRGLDAHQGIVTLFDGETGQVRGIVDASAITAIRTAAVSAVATRALAREGAVTLAVLGAGTQAQAHIEAIACVLPLERVRIYARRPEPAAALAAATAERYALDAGATASVEDALREARHDATEERRLPSRAGGPPSPRLWRCCGGFRRRSGLLGDDDARAQKDLVVILFVFWAFLLKLG